MADEVPSSTPRGTETALSQMRAAIKYADRLSALVAASYVAPHALSPDAVVASIAENSDLDTTTLRNILNAIDNLRQIKAEVGTADSAIERVCRVFGKENLDGIDNATPQIIAAVDAFAADNPIAISLKAGRLSHLYEKSFIDAEIITDARPVYDPEGRVILEYIISHVLALTYHADSGYGGSHTHPRLHIALDADDVLTIKDACERALRKGATLKADLGKKARILGDDG